ncbi:MAG: hypothetical protein IJ131_11815 [Eggerthellaceae bacterium]|nr:hypothetical protein [Eggerthellaceae bacterium]
MNITYSDKLLDYLKRKGISNLHISLAETAVEAGYCEVLVEPMTESQIDDHRNEKYRYIHTIPGGDALGGNIYVTSRGIHFDDDVHFDLKSFLGIRHVTAKGVHAFKLR